MNSSSPQSKFPSPLLTESKKPSLLDLRPWSICPLYLVLPIIHLVDPGGSLTLGNVICTWFTQSYTNTRCYIFQIFCISLLIHVDCDKLYSTQHTLVILDEMRPITFYHCYNCILNYNSFYSLHKNNIVQFDSIIYICFN